MQSPSANPIREDMQQRIEQFAGQVLTDLAAAMAGVMINLGHKLGLYGPWQRVGGPIHSEELARRTARPCRFPYALGKLLVNSRRRADAGRSCCGERITFHPERLEHRLMVSG